MCSTYLLIVDVDLTTFCLPIQAMVARGDLGAELPIEEVPLLQVNSFSESVMIIINSCHLHNWMPS